MSAENQITVLGKIEISDEVIKTIAGIATKEVEGIVGMSGGFIDGIAEFLGWKDFRKGVDVRKVPESDAKDPTAFTCILDIRLVVEYGMKVEEVCRKVQNAVKEKVESLTGKIVKEVNIHVTGLKHSTD